MPARRRSGGRRCRSRAARCAHRAARAGCRRGGRRGRSPAIIAPSIRATIAVRTTPSVSTPASRMPATSSNLKPSRRCMTSTRRVTSVGMRAGHDVAGLARARGASPRRRACWRPRRGSRAPRRSCRRTARRAPAGWPARPPGCARSRCGAIHAIARRSGVHEPIDVGALHLDDDRPRRCGAGRRGPGRSTPAAIGDVGRTRRTPTRAARRGRPRRSLARRRTAPAGPGRGSA